MQRQQEQLQRIRQQEEYARLEKERVQKEQEENDKLERLKKEQEYRNYKGASSVSYFPEYENPYKQSKHGKRTVFIQGKGIKHHEWGCPALRDDCEQITIEEAEQRGFTPCSKCYEITDTVESKKFYVYFQGRGKKFHRKDCHTLDNSKERVELKTAKEKGLEPCSKCDPLG